VCSVKQRQQHERVEEKRLSHGMSYGVRWYSLHRSSGEVAVGGR